MTKNPPALTSCLYEGRVRHRRFAPTKHEFAYSIYMAYLDLTEIERVAAQHPLWSAERANVVTYRRNDHFGDPKTPLSKAVRDLVEKETGRRPRGPIRLMTHLRSLGYVFNPVSFFYCWNPEDTHLETIVAEVSNTPWNETHCYVLRPDDPHARVLRFGFDKEFHVSPFMGMEQRYAWAFNTPREKLTVHMENYEEGEKVFDATMLLDRLELSRATMTRMMLHYPPMAMKVVGAIYWNAFRLWLKRTPFHPHPATRRRTEVPHR